MPRLTFICLLLSLFAQAQSPFDGTWKLKAEHATFSEAPETFELIHETYTCTTCQPRIEVKATGTDQHVSGSKDFDTLSIKRIDAHAVQLTRKKDGKLVSESKDVVSPRWQNPHLGVHGISATWDAVWGQVHTDSLGRWPSGIARYFRNLEGHQAGRRYRRGVDLHLQEQR